VRNTKKSKGENIQQSCDHLGKAKGVKKKKNGTVRDYDHFKKDGLF